MGEEAAIDAVTQTTWQGKKEYMVNAMPVRAFPRKRYFPAAASNAGATTSK